MFDGRCPPGCACRVSSLDEALEWLRHIADAHGDVSRVDVSIRPDGRVTISAEDGPYTRARIESDLLGGGALQMPSAAACDLRDVLMRRPTP
jgi:hypothetical protein